MKRSALLLATILLLGTTQPGEEAAQRACDAAATSGDGQATIVDCLAEAKDHMEDAYYDAGDTLSYDLFMQAGSLIEVAIAYHWRNDDGAARAWWALARSLNDEAAEAATSHDQYVIVEQQSAYLAEHGY